jgi:hypothetical protein
VGFADDSIKERLLGSEEGPVFGSEGASLSRRRM